MKKKIAIVTGGSRGLGKEMALSLAHRGMDVIVTYHTKEEEAGNVVKTIESYSQKAKAIQLDVSDIGSFDVFFDKVRNVLRDWNTSGIDYLVNNAGVGATIPISGVTQESFDRLLNIHFKGVYFLTQLFLPHIRENGGIVFVSTGTTRFCVPGYSVYASLKGAVEVFTKYVAREYGNKGIRANIVAPGPVETDFNNAAIRNNPQLKSFLSGQASLGRVGQADDIGGVVAFLCSEDSKWINAQRIEVSGGIFI